MCMLNTLAHQSSMQELDLLNPILDPRITFSRASSKSYIAKNGLMAYATGNLVLYSEDFTNAFWNKNNSIVTANAATAPDGTNTATKIQDDSSTNYHTVYALSLPLDGMVYARSVYVKKGNTRYVAFSPVSATTSGTNSWIFDFDTGTFTATASNGAGEKITQLADGWWRIEFYNVSTTTNNNRISIGVSSGPNRGDTTYTGSGLFVYAWGAQAEQGSEAHEYLKTTGSVNTNSWPLEYDPATSRSNWIQYSHDFNTSSYWSPLNGTVTPNVGQDVYGGNTACRFSGASAFSQITSPNFTFLANTRYTISLYIQPEQLTNGWMLRAYNASSKHASVELDFTGGTVSGVVTEAGMAEATTWTSTLVSPGRWRISVSFTSTTTIAMNFRFYVNTGSAISKSAIIDGAQVEDSRTASIYVPTNGVAVTTRFCNPIGRSSWEQRTNLIPSSQVAGASLFGITQTDGASTAPDGTATMILQTNNGASGQHWRQDAGHWPSTAVQHTYSIFIKKGTANYVHIFLSKNNAYAQFDLTTGALVFSSAGTATSFSAALIDTLPGGIFRFAVSAINNAGSAENTRLYFLDAAQNTAAPTETSSSTGYWWGEQIEQAAFASPYIPTSGSQVTRSADIPALAVLDKVRFNQSDAQTVGIQYLYRHGELYELLQIRDSTGGLDTSDWLFYSNNGSNTFVARLYPSGSVIGGSFATTANTVNRAAVTVDDTGSLAGFNGQTPKTSTVTLSNTDPLQQLDFGKRSSGSRSLNGWVQKVIFYPSKLTSSELQQMSTPA